MLSRGTSGGGGGVAGRGGSSLGNKDENVDSKAAPYCGHLVLIVTISSFIFDEIKHVIGDKKGIFVFLFPKFYERIK